MGYQTLYSLRVETADPTIDHQIRSMLREMRDDVRVVTDDKGVFIAPCKWYDHEDDLRQLSRQFPAVLLQLQGDGEDEFDFWIKYFRNGKVQIAEAQITFDPFDESKLS